MRFLKHLTCKTIGHEPNYFQARIFKYGQLDWINYARCARCDCSDSRQIHTPGLLDLPAWFLLGAPDMRFTMTEWFSRQSLMQTLKQGLGSRCRSPVPCITYRRHVPPR